MYLAIAICQEPWQHCTAVEKAIAFSSKSFYGVYIFLEYIFHYALLSLDKTGSGHYAVKPCS